MADTIHFNGAIEQVWPFRTPMTHYIQGNIDGRHLSKLYRCCKFFPNRFPLTCVTKLISDYENDAEAHIESRRHRLLKYKISHFEGKKLWIMNELIFQNPVLVVHDWMKKISLCTVQKLMIKNPMFFNEFKLLVHAGTIKQISMSYICDGRLRRIPIEDVLPMIPNANVIRFVNVHATPQTSQKLLDLKFIEKLDHFELHRLNIIMDPQLSFDFIKKHAKPASYFCFNYGDVPENEVTEYCNSLESKVSQWNPTFSPKPTIYTDYANPTMTPKLDMDL